MSNDFPHLSNAPVVEAAVELRSSSADALASDGLDRFQAALVARFPAARDLRLGPHVAITDGGVNLSVPTLGRVGVRLESADGKDIVQENGGNLLVSRLAPYQSWNELIAEVREFWSLRCAISKPSTVTRLGVRYINKIVLPKEVVDLDTILTAGPQIPPTLPQQLQQYIVRFVLPVTEDGCTLSVSHHLDSDENDLIIDIDAYSSTQFGADDMRIWKQLEKLRNMKNRAFFGSLQKAVWEKYI